MDAFRVYYWGTTAPESQYKQVSIFVHDSMIRKKKGALREFYIFGRKFREFPVDYVKKSPCS